MSDERGKGISLRKKRKDDKQRPKGGPRPQVSEPRQISGPVPTGLGAATLSSSGRPSNESSRSGRRMDVPRERPQRADATADLVKRRYSQKITQLPADFGNGAPMPDMPQIPAQFMQQQQQQRPPPSRGGDERPPGSSDGRSLKVDARALRDRELNAEQYVSSFLANASEDDIRRYQDELRRVKNRTSMDLQHNVYQNRTQFIKISKEAEKLKDEMRTLRQLMAELTTTLGETTSASRNGDTMAARKAANRSSIANLEAMWQSNLQQLWKQCEGSQKYLPAIPGRRVIEQFQKWVELNAATWKAKRRVRLILLNDHLLVATEKKQRGEVAGSRDKKSAGVEWVAQRCWPLQDVQVADLASAMRSGDSDGVIQNSINVRVGGESFTYAVSSRATSEKTAFLSLFRKTSEELRYTREAEIEERGRAQDSINYFATRDPNILKKTDLMESLSENVFNNRASMFVDVDGKQQSLRSVESQLDELDIDIALQRFEEAVQKVERLKTLSKNIRSNSMAQGIVAFKVNERASKLANVLIKQLVETNNWISSVQQHTSQIVRLGFEDRARKAYLEARGNLIKTRSRQCTFEGNLPDYIFQISYIYFTIIKNTVNIYQQCFPQVLMSACVKWAKENVDEFNALLKRQLSSVDEDSEIWTNCLEEAREHAKLLKDVGLDFSELVGRGVREGEGGENGDRGSGDDGRQEEDSPVGLGVGS